MLFAVVVAAYLVIAFMPEGPAAPTAAGWSLLQMPRIAWISVLLFSIGVLALGMGNGAVFQLIPLRFRQDIGLMTGLVGCAGGVGGFFLAQALGTAKAATGGFGAGFLFFGGAGIAWLYRTCHGQGPLAHDMGRRIGSAGLTTRASPGSAGL